MRPVPGLLIRLPGGRGTRRPREEPVAPLLLAELSANAGRVLAHRHLLERVWEEKDDGDVRTIASKLRRKLGEDADNPRDIFTEPRVGFRMPTGRAPGGEPPTGS